MNGPPLSLSGLSNKQVLCRVNEVAEELFRRKLITSLTSSPTGGYAEYLVARYFDTEPLKGRDSGFDLIKPDTGVKVQVKARRHAPGRPTTHFGDFGMLEQQRFDEFVGIVFAWDWSIDECWQVPWESVLVMSRLVHGKHRLFLTDIRRAEEAGIHDVVALDLDDCD